MGGRGQKGDHIRIYHQNLLQSSHSQHHHRFSMCLKCTSIGVNGSHKILNMNSLGETNKMSPNADLGGHLKERLS